MSICIRGLRKVFRTLKPGQPEYVALDNVHLELRQGEFFCLVGPSGCGKTTLLDIVAGFEQPTAGEVLVFGRRAGGPGPERGVVFQTDRALFPWLTVEENVAFGLRMRHLPEPEVRARVDRYLHLVGLGSHRRKFPHELSGGMRQRVQIARVLAGDPQVLLMDEPFGALDAQTRRHLQGELEGIWQQTGMTVLFITHDLQEAIILADRVGIMCSGPAAHIKRTVAVGLPRPRSVTPEFAALYTELTAEIDKGVG